LQYYLTDSPPSAEQFGKQDNDTISGSYVTQGATYHFISPHRIGNNDYDDYNEDLILRRRDRFHL